MPAGLGWRLRAKTIGYQPARLVTEESMSRAAGITRARHRRTSIEQERIAVIVEDSCNDLIAPGVGPKLKRTNPRENGREIALACASTMFGILAVLPAAPAGLVRFC